MIKIYADLVEAGLRVFEANVDGIPLVPAIIKDKVMAELERRKNISIL